MSSGDGSSRPSILASVCDLRLAASVSSDLVSPRRRAVSSTARSISLRSSLVEVMLLSVTNFEISLPRLVSWESRSPSCLAKVPRLASNFSSSAAFRVAM